jgi:hypothetical protein
MLTFAARSSFNYLFALTMLLAAVMSLRADDKPAPTAPRKETDLELFEEGTSWTFLSGDEFPGAKGSFELGQDKETRVGKLSYDFTGGGNYVAASTQVRIPENTSELRFKVQGKEPLTILVRLTDESGQVHQWNLPYTQAGQWATLRVPLRSPAAIHWEGKNDGVIYFPIGTLQLGVESASLADKQGQAMFSDVLIIERKPSQP